MTHTVSPITDDSDIAAFLDIGSAVFHYPREIAEEGVERCGRESYRVVKQNGRVVGGLLIYRMGQFFGGRSVPMAGIGHVCIAPDARGSGAARTLMVETMAELRAEGCAALSTLYPATQTLYRQAGFEQAGAHYEIRIPLASIHVRETEADIRALTDEDHDAVAAVYGRCAARRDGSLDRCSPIWHRVRNRRQKVATGLGVFGRDGLEGYLYFIKIESDRGAYDLLLLDLIAETPWAGRALLTLLAHERSLAHQVVWHGGPDDPILNLMPEQPWTAKLDILWMTRVVDVEAALAARGYAPGVSAELHFDVRDDVLPANEGRYVLEVADGRGAVRRGGDGTLAIDVRGLASLYAGFRSPLDLIATGQLSASQEAARRAQAVFAGVAPWMTDMF